MVVIHSSSKYLQSTFCLLETISETVLVVNQINLDGTNILMRKMEYEKDKDRKQIFKCWAVESAIEKCSSEMMIRNERLLFLTQ